VKKPEYVLVHVMKLPLKGHDNNNHAYNTRHGNKNIENESLILFLLMLGPNCSDLTNRIHVKVTHKTNSLSSIPVDIDTQHSSNTAIRYD